MAVVKTHQHVPLLLAQQPGEFAFAQRVGRSQRQAFLPEAADKPVGALVVSGNYQQMGKGCMGAFHQWSFLAARGVGSNPGVTTSFYNNVLCGSCGSSRTSFGTR